MNIIRMNIIRINYTLALFLRAFDFIWFGMKDNFQEFQGRERFFAKA